MSEQANAKKNNKGKMAIIAITIIAVIAVLAVILTADMRTYNKAKELEMAGSYSEAIAIYETIPEYKDTQVRIDECNYQIALGLEADGNYAEALAAFDALGEYSDAPTHADECNYQQALALEAEGNYADALTAFTAIGEYSDAPTHVNECNYQLALALEADGNYEDALAAFTALGEYSDSSTHADECNYQIALGIEEDGVAAEAMTVFTSLNGYKDSADRAAAIDVAITECASEIDRITTQRSAFDVAVSNANTVLEKGETPLDGNTITALNEALAAGAECIIETPAMPENLGDIIRLNEQLSSVDYTDATNAISDATVALENSIIQYGYVNAPTEEFVIDRLMRVPAVPYPSLAHVWKISNQRSDYSLTQG